MPQLDFTQLNNGDTVTTEDILDTPNTQVNFENVQKSKDTDNFIVTFELPKVVKQEDESYQVSKTEITLSCTKARYNELRQDMSKAETIAEIKSLLVKQAKAHRFDYRTMLMRVRENLKSIDDNFDEFETEDLDLSDI